MKAVVFHGIGDIRFETVSDPSIKDSTDAIVRITSSAICGTDLHMIRGTFPGMKRGDRVVIPSTIACGNCSYCRSGYTAQCDDANPNGPTAGTLGIIGVYPQTDRFFPIGAAMNKNLSIHMGNCNHRTYIPKLLEMVDCGTVDPTTVLSHVEPMSDVIEAYKQFDLRRPGWIKVELKPGR